MNYFEKYLKWSGTVERAAETIGCTPQYIYMLRSGKKPMSRQVAEKIEKATNGKFKKERILWE